MVGLAGFVDSIGGGGGLIALPAYIMGGIPVHQALATNKMSSSLGTSVAAFHYLKSGYMKWQFCIPAVIFAILGAFLGSNMSLRTDEKILSMLLLVILPLVALYVIFGKPLEESTERKYSLAVTVAICAISAFVIGFYDGLYGPGTGTFLMIIFSGLCNLTLKEAAGTTKAVNLTSNYISLAVFISSGQVIYLLGLCAGLCSMAGSYIGSHCFSKKGSKITRPIILCVLAIFLAKIIYENLMKIK